MEYIADIGLEVHAQLKTKHKLFCFCPAKFDETVNEYVCPICLGHPGALPILNQEAVDLAVKAGLAVGGQINTSSLFERKNYRYPDLPKGYQISQYAHPICSGGRIEISLASGEVKAISLERIHMEEDAGKLVHDQYSTFSNLNRAGTPLIEIVTKPVMHTPEEASEYLRTLHQLLVHIGVNDGQLQEGSFRCDANVSIRPVGSNDLGTRTEIKNVNSFRFVEKAIAYEITRQMQLLLAGQRVTQETRGFDSGKGVTYSLRSKEDAKDYRYFPEPDLALVHVDEHRIEVLQRQLPELPQAKLARYKDVLGISEQDGRIIVNRPVLLGLFEEAIALGADAQLLAKLLVGDVLRLLNRTAQGALEQGMRGGGLNAAQLFEVVHAIKTSQIPLSLSKQLIEMVWGKPDSVFDIINTHFSQMGDTSELENYIREVLAANPQVVQDFQEGKQKAAGFVVGQVMKKLSGKGDAKLIHEMLIKILQEIK